MIRRGARYLLILLVGTVVVAVAAVFWLLRTESGAAWLWSRATTALPEQLSAQSLRGTVSGGLHFERLNFQQPGTELAIEQLTLAVNPDLFPIGVTVENLQAGGLELRLSSTADEPESTTEPAATVRQMLSSMRLPLPVSIRQLTVNDIDIVMPDASELHLDQLQLVARLHNELQIDQFSVASPLGDASASGMLGLAEAFPLNVSLAANAELDVGTANKESVALALNLDGNLSRFTLDLSSPTHDVMVNGTISDADSAPSFDLVAAASALQWPVNGEQTVVTLQELTTRLTGSISDYGIELDVALTTDSTGPVTATGTLRGGLDELRAEQLIVHSADVDAALNGTVRWADQFSAAAKVDLQRLNPRRWITDWPEQQLLTGSADAELSGARLEVVSLQLRQAEGPADVRAQGVLDLDGGIVDMNLAWSELQWPLAPSVADLASRSAELIVRGTPENWTLSGDIAVSGRDIPEGSFTLAGNGTREGLALVIDDSQVLGGNVTGELAYSWVGENAFSAKLDARSLRTTVFMPDYPGQISSRFAASGQVSPFALDLRIDELSGELRSQAFSASGRVNVDGDQVSTEQLRVQSGESTLLLNGDWQANEGLQFVVDVESLADFLPETAGSLRGEGNLRAAADLPLLSVELVAEDIRWQQILVEKLEARNVVGPDGAPLGLTVVAQNMARGEQLIESASLELNGRPQEHQLSSAVVAADFQASLALHGGVDDWRKLGSARWSGMLDDLLLQRKDESAVLLRQPAAIEMAASQVQLGESCIEVETGGGVCLSGDWAASGSYQFAVELQSLPLDLLRAATGSDLEFTQTLDGNVKLANSANGLVSGTGRVDVTPGLIRNQFDERLTLRTRAGFAAFELDDGQLLAGEISLPFSDAAEINGEFRVLDVGRGQDSPVEGRLTASIRDIGVGARIFPIVDEAKGQLNADIRVGGSHTAPEFSGGLTLRDGRVVYDPLGLMLEDIQVTSEIRPGNRIELQTTFLAGEGRGTLSSSADYMQGRSAGLELSLTGTNLTFVNLDDLSVTIDPDVQLGLRDNDLSINGKIAVPAARLASVNLINNGVSESDDVVYVGEQLPPEAVAAEGESPLNFTGAVELELGDNVIIDLDVAEARLRGTTRFEWRGPALPMARGGFDIAGKFEAYGQLLEISEGAVRFPNVAADNPELRVRAEREIFGNSQIRRAGVLVTGTAQRPKLEVYTNPATSQDRALTLLATGSDFNYEQGVGAVDVGTYIAPRLYASYGIGLFDKENVISVRYDLANGFGIKATSGKRAAGVDISYTIEN
ncbi:MAG: translocation/assembly module TamB domain-containing protein [Woeseia sp.]